MQDLGETIAMLHDLEVILETKPSGDAIRGEAEKALDEYNDFKLEVKQFLLASRAGKSRWDEMRLSDLVKYKETLERFMQKGRGLQSDAIEAINELIPLLKFDLTLWQNELARIQNDDVLNTTTRTLERFMQYIGPRVLDDMQQQLSECSTQYDDIIKLQEEQNAIMKQQHVEFDKKCQTRIADLKNKHHRDSQVYVEMMSWVKYHTADLERPKQKEVPPVAPAQTRPRERPDWGI